MARYYRFSEKNFGIFSSLSVTSIFILINVFAYIFLKITFPDQIIDVNGRLIAQFHPFIGQNIAISLQNIVSLRIWTFITSMFMHAGFFHLFANMISLFFLGSFIERIIGRKRFFYFYLLSGLFAGLLYIIIESFFQSNLGAVGASGAIFGIAGLMVVLTPNLPLYIMFIPIPIKAKYAVPGLLIVLWLISITAGIPIGNTAHLGGLLTGLIYGIYLRNKYRRKTEYINKLFR